jgi:hypothetical protein
MLLNLSNHPSGTWSPEQKSVAEAQFGCIEDLSFPQIDPSASAEDVGTLALEYAQQIESLLERHPEENAVHVMGELTFCVALVRLLQAQHILCVASTTSRDTVENADGTKTSRFRFVQFRTYV